MNYSARMYPSMRAQLEDTMGLEPTGVFDTHPSNGDRIRRARQAANPGAFDLDAPASVLFSNFEVPSKQVTLLHYEDDLGLPMEMAILVPVEDATKTAPAESQPTPGPSYTEQSVAETPAGRLRIKLQGPEA
jgi:hypothetical protein